MNKLTTIESHFLQQQKLYPEVNHEVTDLLHDVALAAKLVRREVVRAGLVDILGLAGSTHVHVVSMDGQLDVLQGMKANGTVIADTGYNLFAAAWYMTD